MYKVFTLKDWYMYKEVSNDKHRSVAATKTVLSEFVSCRLQKRCASLGLGCVGKTDWILLKRAPLSTTRIEISDHVTNYTNQEQKQVFIFVENMKRNL